MTNSRETDAPYYGDAQSQALQRRADEGVEPARNMPGVVMHARAFSVDDTDAAGWQVLRERLSQEGMVILRAATLDQIAQAETKLADLTSSQHVWNFHYGDADSVNAASRPIADTALPPGLELTRPTTDAELHQAQAFMAQQGIAPFSKPALKGAFLPTVFLALSDADSKSIVATGLAAMPHNRFSPWHKTAWVGLIAVDPDRRGLGLGKVINAHTALAALDALNANGVMEFVGPTNQASARMVTSCGCPSDPNRQVVLFSQNSDRPTR